MIVPIILAVGSALTLVMAEGRALLLAQMLAAVWLGAMTLWYWDMLWLLPVLDLAIGATAIRFWMLDGSAWSLSFAFVTLYRLAAHVFAWLTHSAFFVGYAHTLNALFALQLIIIASTGGADGRRRFVSWLRRLRRVGGMGPTRAQGLSRVR